MFLNSDPAGIPVDPVNGYTYDPLASSITLHGTTCDAVFDLLAGSVDLWLLVPEITGTVPLLSRDALGKASEHMTFFLSSVSDADTVTSTRHLVIRHQRMGAGAAVCSEDPLPAGAWVHLAYSFGPPGMELYIDGVRQDSTDAHRTPRWDPCMRREKQRRWAGAVRGGLETEMPWFIAATAQGEPEGPSQTPSAFMDGEALDEIRISAVRRDFADL